MDVIFTLLCLVAWTGVTQIAQEKGKMCVSTVVPVGFIEYTKELNRDYCGLVIAHRLEKRLQIQK